MPLTIVKHPHPALTRPTNPVETIDDKLKQIVREMFELMYENNGIGLAANQVDLPYSLFIMNLTGERVCINPVILDKCGIQEGDEGCLSFPGIVQKIKRAETCWVQSYNLRGDLVVGSVAGLEARAWQHEVDHLEGITFVKRMSVLGRSNCRKRLEELEGGKEEVS